LKNGADDVLRLLDDTAVPLSPDPPIGFRRSSLRP